jgi:hypothetical protein
MRISPDSRVWEMGSAGAAVMGLATLIMNDPSVSSEERDAATKYGLVLMCLNSALMNEGGQGPKTLTRMLKVLNEFAEEESKIMKAGSN